MGNASLTECKEVVCWYCSVTSKYIFAMKLLGTWLVQIRHGDYRSLSPTYFQYGHSSNNSKLFDP